MISHSMTTAFMLILDIKFYFNFIFCVINRSPCKHITVEKLMLTLHHILVQDLFELNNTVFLSNFNINF